MVEIISDERIINGNLHPIGCHHPISEIVSGYQKYGEGRILDATELKGVLEYCAEERCEDAGARFCSYCFKWDESSPNMWEIAKSLLERDLMRKMIYRDYPRGLYTEDNFTGFMESLTGVVQVGDDALTRRKHSDGRTSRAVTYHFEPQGVTLRYFLLLLEKAINQQDIEMATIDLVGKPKNIGEVEKIILGEAERFKE